MAINAYIEDSTRGTRVKVTEYGELVTSSLEYDVVSVQNMDTINTAFNFILPKEGKEVVITGIVISADKNVSQTVDSEIVIYCATSATTTTVLQDVFTIGLVRNTRVVLPPLRLFVGQGIWVNGKCSDDEVDVSIFYHYIQKL